LNHVVSGTADDLNQPITDGDSDGDIDGESDGDSDIVYIGSVSNDDNSSKNHPVSIS
jgi:hypothetical protein